MTDQTTTTDGTLPTTEQHRTDCARTRNAVVARLRDDRGSATAEYAVVILAAVAFAGVLVAVMRSGEVQTVLSELVRGALSL